MLDLRPNCECCNRDLAASSADVYICSFECTWCGECARELLHLVCPNCAGELVRRPIRPASELIGHPTSTIRVHAPDCRARALAALG